MPPMSQCLHNYIKLYIICGVVLSYLIQLFAKKCNCSTCLDKYNFNPTCEALQSTLNTLSKSGKANIGALVTFFLRKLKFP